MGIASCVIRSILLLTNAVSNFRGSEGRSCGLAVVAQARQVGLFKIFRPKRVLVRADHTHLNQPVQVHINCLAI